MDRFEKRDFETKQRVMADRERALTEALVTVAASLRAAISLLERTPQAKKGAPSDKMFAQMLIDYKKALNTGTSALSASPPEQSAAQDETAVTNVIMDNLGLGSTAAVRRTSAAIVAMLVQPQSPPEHPAAVPLREDHSALAVRLGHMAKWFTDQSYEATTLREAQAALASASSPEQPAARKDQS